MQGNCFCAAAAYHAEHAQKYAVVCSRGVNIHWPHDFIIYNSPVSGANAQQFLMHMQCVASLIFYITAHCT